MRISDRGGPFEFWGNEKRSHKGSVKHRLQVTEDHFAKSLQNALQQAAVLPRTGSQAELPAHEKTPVLQGFAAGCEVVQSGRVEDRGLEPLTFWLPARRSPN